MRVCDLRDAKSALLEVTISDTARSAPRRLQRIRNGRSVTPAIGASTTGQSNSKRPIRIVEVPERGHTILQNLALAVNSKNVH